MFVTGVIMKLFVGKLLSVDSTGEYPSLTFASTKYDAGLAKNVECSENIGISKECLVFANEYKQRVGDIIAVAFNSVKTKKGSIYNIATTKPLDLAELGLGG